LPEGQKLTCRYTKGGGGRERSADWRNFHPAEFRDFHSSTNYEGEKMKGDEMGEACGTHWEIRDACRVLVGNPKQRHHLEYLAVDGKIVLMWMFKKRNGGVCEVAEFIAYSIEPTGFINDRGDS
jgi:hypothetical protein